MYSIRMKCEVKKEEKACIQGYYFMLGAMLTNIHIKSEVDNTERVVVCLDQGQPVKAQNVGPF